MLEYEMKTVLEPIALKKERVLTSLTPADVILGLQFENPEFIVEDLITTGLGLICGKPKVGKSRFILKLCIDIAAGTHFLGKFPTKNCKIAYYALEDNGRRVKARLLDMGIEHGLPNVLISNRLRSFDDAGLKEFTQCIRDNPDAKIWVIDTMQKVKPIIKNKTSNAYEDDYNFMGKLQDIAIDNNIALLMIHHSRKDTSSGDFIDSALGSTGLTAAVDVVIILDQDSNDKGVIRLQAKGRDIEERTLKYSAEEFIVVEDYGDDSRKQNAPLQNEIVMLLESNIGGSYSPKEIADLLGKTSNSYKSAIRKALSKLMSKNKIMHTSPGKYYIKEKPGFTEHSGYTSDVAQEKEALGVVSTAVSIAPTPDTVNTDIQAIVPTVSNNVKSWTHSERSALPIIQPAVSVVSTNYKLDNNIIEGVRL